MSHFCFVKLFFLCIAFFRTQMRLHDKSLSLRLHWVLLSSLERIPKTALLTGSVGHFTVILSQWDHLLKGNQLVNDAHCFVSDGFAKQTALQSGS